MRQAFLICLLSLAQITHAQKVGLVLSGGGAKGIAHIGVLKALEENNIPVDYIVGTSMGGIVGGCYAAGMSPRQIEDLMLSEDFLRWVTGQTDKDKYSYYFREEENPGFITLTLTLDSALNTQVNTSLANDVLLNFALAEYMAQAEAIAKQNFDSLFIPLRVMAADVFSQSQIVLKKGSLSKALRATQTVPFFYTPIRVDGKYLFDGGVYNNFPVDVMQGEFKPDVVIGSNVSSKVFNEYPFGKDDELLDNSMLFMFLDKSNPEDVPESGVYLQPNLEGYTAVDFDKARSLIDSGYVQTIRKIDEIKNKIGSRITVEELERRREQFSNKSYPFVFDNLKFESFNSKQQIYLKRVFGFPSRKEPELPIEEVRSRYLKLVSENYFSNTFPTISFNQQRRKFELELIRRRRKNFQVDFGGVLATRDISNIFTGVNFYHFDKQLLHAYIGFQTGNFYTSGTVSTRIDFPFFGQFFVEPRFVYNRWNYSASNDLLREDRTTILRRVDRSYTVKVGWPVNDKAKLMFEFGGIANKDNFINETIFNNTSTLDELKLSGFMGSVMLSANTLDKKQYASTGRAFSISLNYYDLNENHTPGSSSVRLLDYSASHQWLSARIRAEKYFSRGRVRPGLVVEAAYSSMPLLVNYQGTLVNAPAYNPLPDSRSLFLERFRALSYVGGGARLIVGLSPKLDWRTEAHVFKPFESLVQGPNQQALINTDLLKLSLAASSAFVYHSPVGPISLMVNYYDDDENQLGVLFHVGYLLFNKPSSE